MHDSSGHDYDEDQALESKLLSFAEKVQLIKIVIFATTNSWMQSLPLPKFVINKIESLYGTFLWDDGDTKSMKARITWNQVYATKKNGDLNIISLWD